MRADLRRLPNRDVWYRATHERYYAGRLIGLLRNGEASIIVEDDTVGIPWILPEAIPYGKDKVKCWFFHNPTENHREVMEELGVKMGEEDMKPVCETKKPSVSAEFVANVVEAELEAHRDKKNGNHMDRGAKVASGKSK